MEQEAGLVAELLSCARSPGALVRGCPHSSSAFYCAEKGGEVDPGMLRDVRRSGWDLSCHAERDHCRPRSRLRAGWSANDSAARWSRAAGNSGLWRVTL